MLGGTVNSHTNGGFWLKQWPVAGRLTGYYGSAFHKRTIHAPTGSPGRRWVDDRAYVRFLNDEFWNTETAAPRGRRSKPFKKLWLRPYHEVSTTEQEYNYFTIGHIEAPLRGNQAKRRKLGGTRGECPRWEDNRTVMLSTNEKSRRAQCVRRMGKKQKRGAEFHEHEQLRLNQAWVDVLSHPPENPFWKPRD